MAELSDEDIRHLADLAKIRLSDDEVTVFSAQLSDILKYVEQLSAVNTNHVNPTNQVTGLKDVFRNDKDQEDTINRKEILDQTPQKKDGYIKVKRVLT